MTAILAYQGIIKLNVLRFLFGMKRKHSTNKIQVETLKIKSMTKKLLITAFIIALTSSVMPQQNANTPKPVREIGLGLSLINQQARDQIVSPLMWDGLGGGVDFTYSSSRDMGRHEIALRNSVGSISNRYGHEGLSVDIKLGYSYMHRIKGSSLPGELFIGGMLDWNYNIQLYEDWDNSHMYWLNVYEIGPATRWTNNITDNHKIALNINFPFLAIVSRPPKYRYIDQDRIPKELLSMPHETMSFSSLNEYLAFNIKAEYLYQISAKTSFGIAFQMKYQTFSKPERISLLANSLQFNLIYTLGTNKKQKS